MWRFAEIAPFAIALSCFRALSAFCTQALPSVRSLVVVVWPATEPPAFLREVPARNTRTFSVGHSFDFDLRGAAPLSTTTWVVVVGP